MEELRKMRYLSKEEFDNIIEEILDGVCKKSEYDTYDYLKSKEEIEVSITDIKNSICEKYKLFGDEVQALILKIIKEYMDEDSVPNHEHKQEDDEFGLVDVEPLGEITVAHSVEPTKEEEPEDVYISTCVKKRYVVVYKNEDTGEVKDVYNELGIEYVGNIMRSEFENILSRYKNANEAMANKVVQKWVSNPPESGISMIHINRFYKHLEYGN